ncbi:unnamed protein product [Linum tenue]|uniref:Uncharacterized protein n=1 Tax=Linum tenue TaxID=586396 RepID=A0AAV0QPZ9_9ROSI|nr:unnamed protein product [Linum tenue]
MSRQEGIGSLWRGSAMAVNRAMLVTASQLASYDQFKETILEKGVMGDGLGTHVTASFVAGFVAAVVSNPVDVIKNPTPLGPLQLQLVQISVEDHLRHYHNSNLHVAPVLQRHRGSFAVGGVLADDRLLPGGDVHWYVFFLNGSHFFPRSGSVIVVLVLFLFHWY